MGISIEKEKGWTEAILDGNCEYAKFYTAAEILQEDFQINFVSKLNDFGSLYWDFDYHGAKLTLHYDVYLGLSIFPAAFKLATEEDNAKVIGIATLLFEKLEQPGK